MSKFVENDRVVLLSKSCGETLSLNSMLVDCYVGKMASPSTGVVTGYTKDHNKWGELYTVEIDDYDAKYHKFRQYCFKEIDLMREDEIKWDISDDWFLI
jgi:hypothetical protein